MKIYFVDDEVLTLEFLEGIIDWKSLGLEVMGTASNGKEALGQIEKEMPDILVSDIRMPVMDGLTLIDEVRRISSETGIIVLSAYSDFEYARRVFGSGVSGYLVKPVDEDKLLALVEKTIKELQTVRREREKSSHSRNLAIDTLLWEQISRTEPEEVFYRKFRDLGKTPDFPEFQILSITLPDVSVSRGTVTEILGDGSTELSSEESYLVKADTGSWLLISGQDTGSQTIAALEALFRSRLSTEAYITVSARHRSPGELGSAYKEVCTLNSLHFYSRDHTYTFYRKRQPRPALKEITLNETAEKCLALIRKQNAHDVREFIIELNGDLMQKFEADTSGYRNFWTLFCLLIRNRMIKEDKAVQLPLELRKLDSTSFQTCSRASDITGIVQDILQKLMEEPSAAGADVSVSHIRDIKIYIKEHSTEKITLEDIAEQFFMSRNYLSRLFSDTTGTTLWDYLTMVRIRNAENLLKETGKGTAEIARLTGYDNQGYFSSVFKKKTGLTPMQYRKNSQK